jgi:hypothetical protein
MEQRGIYALFTVALLLGYFDFALELASKTWAQTNEKIKPIKQLILQLAEYNPLNTHQSINELIKQVNGKPELANIMVGGYVDRRRSICNYDDVLNVDVTARSL